MASNKLGPGDDTYERLSWAAVILALLVYLLVEVGGERIPYWLLIAVFIASSVVAVVFYTWSVGTRRLLRDPRGKRRLAVLLGVLLAAVIGLLWTW